MVESASEAIRVLDEKRSQFDLVLTDVMMPDVGGIGVNLKDLKNKNMYIFKPKKNHDFDQVHGRTIEI